MAAERTRSLPLRVAEWLALFSANRPRLALLIGLAMAVAAACLIPSLRISTSRTDLVSAKNPHQRELFAFYDRFGYPDDPVIIVTGGTPDARRAFVDRAMEKLEALPELKGRVLARVNPDSVAELLLLLEPAATAKGLERLGPDVNLSKVVSGGLPGWLTAFEDQVSRGLESGTAKPEEAEAGLGQLRTMILAFDDEMQGVRADERLAALAKDSTSKGRVGVDELGYLVGSGDHHVIALFPEIEGDEAFQVAPLVNKIRAVRDEVMKGLADPSIRADVTGVPALVTDEHDIVDRDIKITGILSAIAIALSLIFAFRSFRQASVSFLPIAFGTLVTMGLGRLVFGKLNLITSSFTSVLLGLGDFGVHIQARYAELMRGGAERQLALRTALLKAGPGLLVGTIVTAAAFLTTTITEFTAFAQLGLLTCIGLFVMLIGTYLLIAPMVQMILGKKPKVAPEIPGMRLMGRFIRRFPKQIVVVSALVTVAFAFFVRGIEFNGRYFDLLPADAEASKGLLAIEKDRVLTPISANIPAESIEEARDLAEKLRALDSVASVETPSDFLPPLDAAALAKLRENVARFSDPIDFAALGAGTVKGDDVTKPLEGISDALDEAAFALRQSGKETKPVDDVKAAIKELVGHIRALPDGGEARLTSLQRRASAILERAIVRAKAVAARGEYAPEDIPPLWQNRFVSKDKKAVALYVHPKEDVWDVKASERFTADLDRISPHASGIATTLAEHPRMIVEGFQKATAVAIVLVIVILFLSFRNLREMLVAAVPLVMGAIWMLGSMRPLGLQFNHANMVVLPLLLGLGVDAGVHIMVRYKQSAADHGGVADIDEMLCSTGGAVLIASSTTIFGFAVMLLASYRGMITLGKIMSIGMTATLALTLLVIPAMLIWMKKAK